MITLPKQLEILNFILELSFVVELLTVAQNRVRW